MPIHGITATYQPFSFQERLAPLQMMKEEYDKINEGLAVLGESANQYYQYLDPETRQVVDSYNATLKQASDDIAANGMKAVNRNTLNELRRQFTTQVSPIQNAAKSLEEMYAQKRQLESKLNASGQVMFSGRMPTVKELLENPDAAPQIVSSGALYQQGMNASKTASARNFYESAFGREKIDGYIRTVQTQGYSPELVQRSIQDVSTIPELAADINRIREMYNTQGLTDPIAADRFIMQGILDGIGYSQKSEYKEDIIGKENRAFARSKALAQFNADLEVDTARRMAAISDDKTSGLTAHTRTIVSPRAVNTSSQQFYDSKTRTVEIPDNIFDSNGRLKKSSELGVLNGGTKLKKLREILGEQYTQEQIDNMTKDDITKIVEGMVHNSLQDAEGNSGYYWNLDISNTKELLSRTGQLYEIEGKENGKWAASRNTKDVLNDQKDKGSQLVYDPVSNELMLAFDNSKKMYSLDKSIIGDEEVLDRLSYYTSRDSQGNSILDIARYTLNREAERISELQRKAENNGGRLSQQDMEDYARASQNYTQAVAVLEDSNKLFSSIGNNVMSYLGKQTK